MIRNCFVWLPALLLTGCLFVPPSRHEVRKRAIQKREADPSREALARRARTNELLKTEGVPTLATLPVVESSKEAKVRTKEEVLRRALALLVVALKGSNDGEKVAQKFARQFGVREFLSPKERAFWDNPNPSAHDALQFSWRFECLHALGWSLGLVDEMERPDRQVDVARLVEKLEGKDFNTLLRDVKLRPVDEILDEVDLIYRYHWATRDADLNGKQRPAGLDDEVVMERHHALNWLIGYSGEEWDDVSTDT